MIKYFRCEGCEVATGWNPVKILVMLTMISVPWGLGGGPLKSGLKRKKIGSVNTDNFFKQFQWGQ